MSRNIVAAALALTVVLLQPVVAEADDIKIWTARAIATVLAEIGHEFERETGHTLTISSDLPPAFLRRANAGESFDVLISGSPLVDEWIRDGRIIAETRTDIARSGIGVEVRAGAPKPDISSVDAFKRALVNAKSIAYLRIGSGIYLAGLLERLGLAEAIKSKVTRPESDIVSELVAKGEVELGMTVITQILTTPGVDLVGPLPPEVQSYVTFAAGVSSHSSVPDAARRLIKFLGAPGRSRSSRLRAWRRSSRSGSSVRQGSHGTDEPGHEQNPAIATVTARIESHRYLGYSKRTDIGSGGRRAERHLPTAGKRGNSSCRRHTRATRDSSWRARPRRARRDVDELHGSSEKIECPQAATTGRRDDVAGVRILQLEMRPQPASPELGEEPVPGEVVARGVRPDEQVPHAPATHLGDERPRRGVLDRAAGKRPGTDDLSAEDIPDPAILQLAVKALTGHIRQQAFEVDVEWRRDAASARIAVHVAMGTRLDHDHVAVGRGDAIDQGRVERRRVWHMADGYDGLRVQADQRHERDREPARAG